MCVCVQAFGCSTSMNLQSVHLISQRGLATFGYDGTNSKDSLAVVTVVQYGPRRNRSNSFKALNGLISSSETFLDTTERQVKNSTKKISLGVYDPI